MYNDPQGSYPPPDPQWGGNGNANNGAQNSYLPQNPAPQWGENGTANVQQGPYPSTQNFTPQWGNGTANFQQGPYPPQNPAPVQPNFVYATPSTPSRRSGLISSQSAPKNNLSMIMIGGATALALIVGLALFVGLSSQGQKSSTPVIQTSVATPAATPDTATPTPEATATPMPTPTVVATPTTASNTTASTYAPPPAVQQPAPVPTPMPVAPTPTPKPTATVAPITFTYDYNPVNGILLTNPPANFCAAGQAAQTAGVQCVADFATNAGGYVVTCRDGIHVSHNGGKGACAGKPYGGEGRKWYEHQVKK